MKTRNRYGSVAGVGMDVQYEFSTVTMRDANEKVVCRERLEHRDRAGLRRRLSQWPKGVPVVLEASFGWGWLSDEMLAVGMDVHLSNCYKLEQLRQARGQVHTNRKDADLLSLLPLEGSRWWEVWRAPKEVRDQRELTRYWIVLKAMDVEVRNRLHALCHRHGIFYDLDDLFGGRHLGKQGNHLLKWAMILGVRGAVRKGGKWRKIFERYTCGGRNGRNRGYIKVARELVKVVDVVWRKDVEYTDTPAARPGCRGREPGRDRASRSGTGRLSCDMVAAR